MKGKITIGSKQTEVVVNAATPLFFRSVFGTDIYSLSMNLTDDDSGEAVDTYSRLFFVMAMQAKKADLRNMNEDDYIAWLEKYLPMDMAMACLQVAEFYVQQTQPNSKPKN